MGRGGGGPDPQDPPPPLDPLCAIVGKQIAVVCDTKPDNSMVPGSPSYLATIGDAVSAVVYLR